MRVDCTCPGVWASTCVDCTCPGVQASMCVDCTSPAARAVGRGEGMSAWEKWTSRRFALLGDCTPTETQLCISESTLIRRVGMSTTVSPVSDWSSVSTPSTTSTPTITGDLTSTDVRTSTDDVDSTGVGDFSRTDAYTPPVGPSTTTSTTGASMYIGCTSLADS